MDYLLSIVIPTYNRSFSLDKLLASIYYSRLNKDDYEVIISDDSDNENEIKENIKLAENYISRGLMNIKYIRNKYKRVGPAANRQNGLDESQGRWITFVDDDDIFIYGNMNYIMGKLEYYKDTQISCIITEPRMVDMNDNEIEFSNEDDFEKILTHGKIYNKNFLNLKNISYDVTAPAHEDIYFNYQVLCGTYTDSSWSYICLGNASFYKFYNNPDSLSHSFEFYDNYITRNPKWFLNKFDKPFDYLEMIIDDKELINTIYNLIKNELFYAVIIYIMMGKWDKATDENQKMYKDFFDRWRSVLKGKIEQKEIINEATRVMQDNGLMNISDIVRYFSIIDNCC